jgi:chemotaxis protein methyltransferase CheR
MLINPTNTEIHTILELINSKFNVDFTEYSKPTMGRRLDRLMKLFSLRNIQEIKDLLLADSTIFPIFRNELTVTTTELFRDISFWKDLKETLIPKIKSTSSFTIWSNGCSSGEELYSIAILLSEFGLLDKVKLIGSDINTEKLEIAKSGLIDSKLFHLYEGYYKEIFNENLLSKYIIKHSNFQYQFIPELRNTIDFEYIDTIQELPNFKYDFILMRNVLIYFNMELQNKVIGKVLNQLNPNGFFALGMQENISWCDSYSELTPLTESNIFTKN